MMPADQKSPSSKRKKIVLLAKIFSKGKITCWFKVRFQGNAFNITVIQAYAPTNNAEEAEVERFYKTF